MREPESWHAHANSRDTHTDASLHVGQGGSGSRAEVHDHGNKSLAILALIFGAGGVFMALILAILLYGLWSRHDLLRIYYNDIRTELIRQGGNPHPHMPSESP